MINLILFAFENNQFVFHHLYEWFIFGFVYFLICHLMTKYVTYESKKYEKLNF